MSVSEEKTFGSFASVTCDPWLIVNRPDGTQLFGLCAFVTTIHCPANLHGTSLRVRLGHSEAHLMFEDVAHPLAKDLWSIRFHVNTHLLDSGPAHLEAYLRMSDGNELPLSTKDVVISELSHLGRAVQTDLRAFGSPPIFGKIVDSSLYPHDACPSAGAFDGAAGAAIPLRMDPCENHEAALKHMACWGFAVLPELIPADLVHAFNMEYEHAIDSGVLKYERGSSDRTLNAHRLPSGRKIWLYPPVLAFLRKWFRDEPCACQTLLFINSSQQSAHQDTIHLTPYPGGYMCGVWAALEDVRPNSGELFVYPGSHRTQRIFARTLGLPKVFDDYSPYHVFETAIKELVEAGGYERMLYRAKAGQVLVWHENLVHGAHFRIDLSLTRRSIVSHYFARGAVAYYDARGEAAFLENVDDVP